MGSSKLQLGMSCVALVTSLALAAEWMAGISFDGQSLGVREGLLLLGLVLATASLAYSIHRASLGAARRQVVELEARCLAIETRARQFEAQTQCLHSILLGLSEPLLAIDENDEVVLANPSAEELFSIDPDKTAGRALAKLVRCEKLVELLTETRGRNVPSQRSCEIAIPDGRGSLRWYRVAARNIPAESAGADDPRGSQGVVAVLHDISSQKTSQKHTAELVSVISHEMKTPLAAIKAYVELLLDGEMEDDHTPREFLEIINSQANRLERLMDNMLNLARLEAGVTRINKQNCSLNALLAEAVERVQPAAEGENVTLRSELSPVDLDVLVDRDMALRAAVHLLSNAVKSSPHGGQVTLRTRAAGNEAQFDIEDNGAGLTSEDCQRVFEKFYRVRHGQGAAGGTGLGLPLVKHIVEHVHGGSIEVQSTPGKGSVFSVYLPSAPAMS